MSIIDNKALRFSDTRFVNDKSEGNYIAKVLLEYVDKNREKHKFFSKIVDLLFEGVDKDAVKNLKLDKIEYKQIEGLRYDASRHFLFCCCTENDSLNMWNYYVKGGNYQGYNIGIKVSDFIKTFATGDISKINGFQVYYGEVLYEKRYQYNEIEKWASYIEKYFYGDDDRSIIELRLLIDSKGFFFKSKKFLSENEYRFLICIDDKRVPIHENDGKRYFGDKNKNIVEGLCVKNGIIFPYLNISFLLESISRITVSPITEFGIAKCGIKELLRKKENSSVPVYPSRIPIRF